MGYILEKVCRVIYESYTLFYIWKYIWIYNINEYVKVIVRNMCFEGVCNMYNGIIISNNK